ncbi:hypothetical protein ACFOKI_10190 [Sphingomonas qilianensis]|uniref:Uncharacterized protein n=1 Tax=Sphingomonas qilianensis TaxID=1736690 RepID=A0ABU9XPZ8_9SPHN
MKFVLLAAALSLPAIACAQTAPAPAASIAASSKFSLDTPLTTIIADPVAKAVLDKNIPGVSTHPMFEQFKGMSLNQVAPMAGGAITPEMLAKASADLSAIK